MTKRAVAGTAGLIVGVALTAWGTGAAGDTPKAPDSPKSKARIEAAGPPYCVRVARIRGTKIVDDSTILFQMRSGKTYRNKLPYECDGLWFEDGFAYGTQIERLCSTDTITVLNRGTTCGLGQFKLVKPQNKNGKRPK